MKKFWMIDEVFRFIFHLIILEIEESSDYKAFRSVVLIRFDGVFSCSPSFAIVRAAVRASF